MHTVTIHGLVFPLPTTFSAGDTLEARPAELLETSRRNNIRNNFSWEVKAALGDQDPAEVPPETMTGLLASFAEYERSYTFAVRGPRSRTDPVLLEACRLARLELKTRLRSSGVEMSPEDIERQVLVLVQAQPQFRTEAQRRIDAQRRMGQALLEQAGA